MGVSKIQKTYKQAWPKSVACTRFRRHRVRCFDGTGETEVHAEFKLETVRLIKDRGLSYVQASQELGVHTSQLRDWVKKFADDPQHAFPGHGQMKPEQVEIARLKREVAKLKAELFSRHVVGWSMSAAMTAQLVTDALVMAIWRRGKPDALLHHSDRGTQCTSEQFQRLMADNGVACSMSRPGNVRDNAAMESLFSSLKTERTARRLYRTQDEAKVDVFDCIERFYNPKRRHSRIGYRTPMEFHPAGLARALEGRLPTSANA